MSTMAMASSQQSFLSNPLLTTTTHKPKTPPFQFPRISINCSSQSHYSSRSNDKYQLAKVAMVTLAAGVLTLGSVDPAFAAKSGGRVGGQAFRSAPRQSAPRTNNSRTNIYVNPRVAPPLGGGYGYGYGAPLFGGWGWSPFSFYAPGPAVAVGIGGGFDTLVLFMFLGAAAAFVRRFFQSRDDDDDDDY